jgi:hypothetical protein
MICIDHGLDGRQVSSGNDLAGLPVFGVLLMHLVVLLGDESKWQA